MDEIEYIRRIDTCFPFRKARKWKPVIDQGISFSDNAAYMALHAIVFRTPSRLPRSETQRMMDYWSSKYDHPTKAVVLTAARAIVSGRLLPEEEVLKYVEAVSQYWGLFNALGIVYAAARFDERTQDTPEAVERRCREIFDSWSA